MDTSFYSQEEIDCLGFKSVGTNVMISRKASVYDPGVIQIGDHVRIDDFCVLSGGVGIRLGSFVHIACFVALFGGAGIIVEDFSGLSARTTVYSQSDDFSGMSLTGPLIPAHLKPLFQGAPVAVGRHVIVGANTTILPGVEIGEGVAVGAHSLVTRDCEEWWIYAGVPAKRIKPRSRKMLALEKQFLDEISRT